MVCLTEEWLLIQQTPLGIMRSSSNKAAYRLEGEKRE